MTKLTIKAVLNPKGYKSPAGESIYICIYYKTRYYIHLGLEKIPAKAWSGKDLRWVNSQYYDSDNHNKVIDREILRLKEIIREHERRGEILTAEKLKNIYLVKYQGKRIKGVNGTSTPGASNTIVSFIEYSLDEGSVSKKAAGTRKVYVTLKNLISTFKSNALMADLDESFVLGFIEFMQGKGTKINSDATVAKYVDRLKVIYREYCDYYDITLKKRIFERLDIDFNKKPDKIIYVNDDYYQALSNLKFTLDEKRLEITRDIFLLLCNTALYYNDLIAIESISAFDPNLIKLDSEFMVLQGERKKNGENFWIPLNETSKQIIKKYYVEGGVHIFPREVAISEPKFNLHLKVLADRINFPDVLSNKVGRKTFGTWTDRLGMGDNDIRIIFGHSPGSVLKKHYTERRTVETYQRILSFIQR